MSTKQSRVIVKLFGAQHQAIVSLGDTHFVVGSSLARDIALQSSRAQEMLLAALATDCTFVCQDAIHSIGINQNGLTISARFIELDHVEVRFVISNLNDEQCQAIVTFIKTHCQLYQLLAPVLNINLRIVGEWLTT